VASPSSVKKVNRGIKGPVEAFFSNPYSVRLGRGETQGRKRDKNRRVRFEAARCGRKTKNISSKADQPGGEEKECREGRNPKSTGESC